MRANRTSRSDSQAYVIAFRVYVQADGSMIVVFGNQRLDVTADEAHALLCGTLEYARVFAALHNQIDTTTLEIASGNGKMEVR